VNRTAWEDEFWTPELDFLGKTVLVLGGGPGLTPAVVSKLHGRHCIAVNSSYLIAPPDALLFFTDNGWFEGHTDAVNAWRGRVVTQSRASKRSLPSLLRVGSEAGRRFPPAGSPRILQGKSTGQTAIALAIAMGASTVILLGFDMQVVGGREHHHDDYLAVTRTQRRGDPMVYQRQFLPAFEGWDAMARRAGVVVLNATPGSALKEFPMVVPEAVLC